MKKRFFGAVMALLMPAANRPIPKNAVAQLPSSGSSALAISAPELMEPPAAWMVAAAQMMMAMEIRPPRPIESTESKRELTMPS